MMAISYNAYIEYFYIIQNIYIVKYSNTQTRRRRHVCRQKPTAVSRMHATPNDPFPNVLRCQLKICVPIGAQPLQAFSHSSTYSIHSTLIVIASLIWHNKALTRRATPHHNALPTNTSLIFRVLPLPQYI